MFLQACRFRRGQGGRVRLSRARADINYADAIVRIEYGDGIVWPNRKPMGKGSGIARKQRMQHERRECEIVHPIDLARDFQLLQIVAMNFDKDFHPEGMRFAG